MQFPSAARGRDQAFGLEEHHGCHNRAEGQHAADADHQEAEHELGANIHSPRIGDAREFGQFSGVAQRIATPAM